MKGIFCAAAIVLMGGTVFGESLERDYLAAYTKINEAERTEKTGDLAGALADYKVVFGMLQSIQKQDPDWEKALVVHRMSDAKAKIEVLQPQVEADAGAKNTVPRFEFTPVAAGGAKPGYPWKENVFAELFWIGEKSTARSVWNPQWVKANGGDDAPRDRDGYSTEGHASQFNPFYVALPFNDLTHADEAAKLVPESWRHADKNVSACRDRWVELKNLKNNAICFAQWEDVGPGGDDRPGYVFGDEKPGENAGISVSPAVGECLNLKNENNTVSWRFVDEVDVRPGPWLKLDEQAVLFRAMHQDVK